MTPAMSDGDLLTLCVLQEAGNQVPDGMGAVARVVLNRTRRKYASDGTIAGTILGHDQFSWTEFAMKGGVYRRVATDGAQELARVARLMTEAKAETGAWSTCQHVAWAVQQGSYHGSAYDKLTDDTVLYDNLALARPAWALPSKLVVAIPAHTFFRA